MPKDRKKPSQPKPNDTALAVGIAILLLLGLVVFWSRPDVPHEASPGQSGEVAPVPIPEPVPAAPPPAEPEPVPAPAPVEAAPLPPPEPQPEPAPAPPIVAPEPPPVAPEPPAVAPQPPPDATPAAPAPPAAVPRARPSHAVHHRLARRHAPRRHHRPSQPYCREPMPTDEYCPGIY